MKIRLRRKRQHSLMMPVIWFKIIFGIIVGVVVILLAVTLVRPVFAADEGPQKAQQTTAVAAQTKASSNGPYEYQATVSHLSNARRRVSLSVRPQGGKWLKRVTVQWNCETIPTFDTAVGKSAAQALRSLLVWAADASWGANIKCVKKTATAVTWKVKFFHWYRGNSGGKMTKYPVRVVCYVQAKKNKKGLVSVTYAVGSCTVARASIETLIMKQSTTVHARLGTYVPPVK